MVCKLYSIYILWNTLSLCMRGLILPHAGIIPFYGFSLFSKCCFHSYLLSLCTYTCIASKLYPCNIWFSFTSSCSCSNQLSFWPTRSLICPIQGHVCQILHSPSLCIITPGCKPIFRACIRMHSKLETYSIFLRYTLFLIGHLEPLLSIWVTASGKTTWAISAPKES